MIAQVLKQKIVPDHVAIPFAQTVVRFCAILIPGYGFYKMASLGLTEAQWLLGLAVIIALDLQCMILDAIIDLKRKSA